MSEDIRKMIDKVKNFKQFVNEDKVKKYDNFLKTSVEQDKPENVNIVITNIKHLLIRL